MRTPEAPSSRISIRTDGHAALRITRWASLPRDRTGRLASRDPASARRRARTWPAGRRPVLRDQRLPHHDAAAPRAGKAGTDRALCILHASDAPHLPALLSRAGSLRAACDLPARRRTRARPLPQEPAVPRDLYDELAG